MMADVHSEEQLSLNMSRIKNRDTNPEVRLRSVLYKTAYRFRLHTPDLPERPDIVLPNRRHEGRCFTTTPATQTKFWLKQF